MCCVATGTGWISLTYSALYYDWFTVCSVVVHKKCHRFVVQTCKEAVPEVGSMAVAICLLLYVNSNDQRYIYSVVLVLQSQ